MEMSVIGFMKSVFLYKNGTPRQSFVCQKAKGSITIEKRVFNNPEHSLQGIEEYSHIWIMFVFHQNNNPHFKAKVRPPRLGGKRVGVFSTRSPYRPNPIGLTLAKLEKVEGATLYLSGIDILDGTPILDIKPYIPDYDSPLSHIYQSTDDSGDARSSLDKTSNKHVEEDINCEIADCSADSDARSSLDKTLLNSFHVSIEAKHIQVESNSESVYKKSEVENKIKFSKLVNCIETDVPQNKIKPTEITDNEKTLCEISYSTSNTESDSNYSTNITSQENNHRSYQSQTPSKLKDISQNVVSGETTPPVLKPTLTVKTEQIHPRNIMSGETTPPVLKPAVTVKTAQWLDDSKRSKIKVRFTASAKNQMEQFSCNNICDKFKFKFLANSIELSSAIVEILEGDPRSLYRKKSCKDSLYYMTVDVVHVTCWFDDNQAEVVRIKPIVDVEILN